MMFTIPSSKVNQCSPDAINDNPAKMKKKEINNEDKGLISAEGMGRFIVRDILAS